MQCNGTDLADDSQDALLENSPFLCHFHFLFIIQFWLPKPNMIIETLLVTFESGKTLFQYFHLFSTLEYFNTGLSRRMGPYLEALVCAATFPFTFCSAAWFSVEVVRSTIFEEMEGEVEGIVPPAA